MLYLCTTCRYQTVNKKCYFLHLQLHDEENSKPEEEEKEEEKEDKQKKTKIKQRNVPSSIIIILYLKKCLAIILMGYYGKP